MGEEQRDKNGKVLEYRTTDGTVYGNRLSCFVPEDYSVVEVVTETSHLVDTKVVL